MTSKPFIRMLLVDDSSGLRHTVMHLIGSEYNFEFLEAGNGEEAETLLQESIIIDSPIDIIFLDWMMPKVTGKEFLAKIKTSGAYKNLPKIVMVSAETYPDQIQACLKYGVDDYITKPFSKEQLLNSIKKVMGKKDFKNAL